LCLFSLACGFAYPIQRQLLNDTITEDGHRATLMSLESIIDRAVCAWVAAILSGTMLGGGGLSAFLLASAGVTLAAVLILGLLLKMPLSIRRENVAD
jgi:hypothetical protein